MIKSKKKGGKATTLLPRQPIISEQRMDGPKMGFQQLNKKMDKSSIEKEHIKYIEHIKHHFYIELIKEPKKESLNNDKFNIDILFNIIKNFNNTYNSDILYDIIKDIDLSDTNQLGNIITTYRNKIESNNTELKSKITGGGILLSHFYDDRYVPSLESMQFIKYVKDFIITNKINNDSKLMKDICSCQNMAAFNSLTHSIFGEQQRDYQEYSSFLHYIYVNKNNKEINVEIPSTVKFEIKSLTEKGEMKPNGNPTNILRCKYNAHEYNDDIVTDFEKNLIESQDYIKSFMQKQNDAIKDKLTAEERWTIVDYTADIANPFYGCYKSKNFTQASGLSWLQLFELKYNTLNFGNAFLPQILKYIDFILKNKSTHQTTYNKIESVYGSHNYDDIQIRYINATNTIRGESPFAHVFDINDWEEILKLFEEDINAIIKKMPTPDKPIYCYRGVTRNYINLDAYDATFSDNYSLKCYYISRITSLSINFEKAKQFYNMDHSDNSCLYRVAIMPGCNMLFISSLSIFPNEYEIILPTYSIVLDAEGWNSQIDLPVIRSYEGYQRYFNERAINSIKYNNRNNEWGVCGTENDKLKSLDIVIIGSKN